jgi:hypothetical protein
MHRAEQPMGNKPLVLLFIGILGLVHVSWVSWGHAHSTQVPFYPGETLVYVLKWGNTPVGEAHLRVMPTIETINGIPGYHFVLTAKSNAFIDMFYKVRERVDAYADLSMTRALLYKKKQVEGRAKRDIVVVFDWDQRQAQYYSRGIMKRSIDLLPGTFDPLSVLYYTRLFNLVEHTQVEGPVTDGRKLVIGKASILRRETITIADQDYDTVVIEPELKDIGGVFEKSKDAKLQLWITADEHQVPVRIKSKVLIGSFVGELIDKSSVKF